MNKNIREIINNHKKKKELFDLVHRSNTELLSIDQGARKSSSEYKNEIYELIENGVDINAKDKDGVSIMHYIAQCGNLDLMDFLLSNFRGKIEINLKDSQGQTPLHYAASSSDLGVFCRLFGNGADSNTQDQKGKLPINLFHEDARKAEAIAIINKLKTTPETEIGDMEMDLLFEGGDQGKY